MKTYLKKLTVQEMEVIKHHRPIQVFTDGSDILGPNALLEGATLLLEGEFCILKNDEAFLRIPPGYVLGLREVIHRRPNRLRCKAIKDSKGILLKREDFLISDNEHCPIRDIILRLIDHEEQETSNPFSAGGVGSE